MLRIDLTACKRATPDLQACTYRVDACSVTCSLANPGAPSRYSSYALSRVFILENQLQRELDLARVAGRLGQDTGTWAVGRT